jgi:hypothetical protein
VSDGAVEKNQHEVIVQGPIVVAGVSHLVFCHNNLSVGTGQRVVSDYDVVRCASHCAMAIRM